MHAHAVSRFVISASTALVTSACTLTLKPQANDLAPVGTDVITGVQIEKSSATNVWDLLRTRAYKYDFKEDRNGVPTSIQTRHGKSSVALKDGDTPVVLVDGARLTDFRFLRQMSTESIDMIEMMNGIAGTVTQGTNASAGVILIHTKGTVYQ
ncbi:MAG TPA: TonB-dependent receptor plug domain-containing protein [Gemmatimonadaceae bacterium]|jgi:outer membrane cobalamin receptor